MPAARPALLPPAIASGIAWMGVALALWALASGLWREVHWPRVSDALLLMGGAAAVARLVRRLTGMTMASGIAVAWLVMWVVMVGPMSVLATGLVAAAALGIGLHVSRRVPIALACGLAVLAGVVGWLLQWPLHQRWPYALTLTLLAAASAGRLRPALRDAGAAWRAAVRAAPVAAAWALMLLGVASAGTWLPTMQFDDIAYHLGLPVQLQAFAVYRPDAAQQVWAFAPWAGDVLQGVARVLADGDARGAINLMWLAIAAAGLHAITGTVGGDIRLRWAAVALFATLPLTQGLAASMQTELPAAAVTLTLGWLMLAPEAGLRGWLAGGLLMGLLAGLKLMHPLLALPLLALGMWRHRALQWRLVPAALAAFALAGASSYVAAWRATGNPVLPLFNARFHSPFMPAVNFDDPRWHAGVDPWLPWNLSVHTRRYFEGHDGSFGLLLLAGAGLLLLALLRRPTRGWTLAALAALCASLTPLQYARYGWVPLVVAIPALAGALAALPHRQSMALLAGICGLQFVLLANADWTIRAGAIKYSVLAGGRDATVLQRFAPQRLLVAAIDPAQTGTTLVLDGTLAELGPRGRTIAWYAPRNEAAAAAAERDASGHAWANWMRQQDVREVVTFAPNGLTAPRRAALQRLGARQSARAGDAELWQLPGTSP